MTALGPKNYCLLLENQETKKTKAVTKVRGFTLSHSAAQTLTRQTLKGLVDNFVQFSADNEKVSVPNTQIRKSKDFKVTSNNTPKQYSVCYDKRVITSDNCTLPFGF